MKKLIFTFTILISLTFNSTFPQSKKENRELILEGNMLFTYEEIILYAGLQSQITKSLNYADIAKKISDFYKENGYTLVKTHLIEDSPKKLVIYINEGHLARIIVAGLNNYYSLKVKLLIDFPERVYNTEVEKETIKKIEKKYGFKIRTELKKIANFDDSIFQLDREIRKIQFLNKSLKIFSDYPAEYDLFFYIEGGKELDPLSLKRDGFSFNIDYNYPSEFVPTVSLYWKNIFYGKDFLKLELSCGFDFDFNFQDMKNGLNADMIKIPPSQTFAEIYSEYKINPFLNEFIGPILITKLYQSQSAREDIGITQYHYIQSRFTLAPEFTFLKYLDIYAGFGFEKVFFYGHDYTQDEHYTIDNNRENYPFIETRFKLEPIPIRIGSRINKNMILTITDYYGDQRSREIKLNGEYDFEFGNLSIYGIKFKSDLFFYNPPFHHSESANSYAFKGLYGASLYTNREFSLSNEYRMSLYQDYLYGGVFVDGIWFKAEGLTNSGSKKAIAAGPTARILIYDQFELILYLSKDILMPDGTIGNNFQVKLRKKW